MPFLSNEFDTVIMTEVLEHVPYPINTLKEVYRVLNVGGFILSQYLSYGPYMKLPMMNIDILHFH